MSSSGYYKWLKRKPSKQKKRRHRLLNRILQIFKDSNCTYGSPRIYKQLRAEGFRCTERTVAELMKKHQITPKRRRKFVKITDSSHDYPIAPNLLGRDFDSKEPDEVWVSDITYSAPRPLVGAHMCGMHHTIKEVKQKEIAVLYAAVECEPKRR